MSIIQRDHIGANRIVSTVQLDIDSFHVAAYEMPRPNKITEVFGSGYYKLKDQALGIHSQYIALHEKRI